MLPPEREDRSPDLTPRALVVPTAHPPRRMGGRRVKCPLKLSSGAPARGIYDNMKKELDTVFVGKHRACNRRFLQICGH